MLEVYSQLRDKRLSLGWSQTYLGKRAKLNQSVISQLETGRLAPYDKQIKGLAKAFKVRPSTVSRWLKV